MVWSQLNTGAKIIKTFQHCYSTSGAQPPSELSPSQMLLLSLSLQPWAGLGGSRKVEAQELWHWALWLMDKGVDDLFILVPHQSGAQLLRNDPHRDRQQWAASVLLQGNLFNNLFTGVTALSLWQWLLDHGYSMQLPQSGVCQTTEGGCARSPFSPHSPPSLPAKQLLREGLQKGFPKEHTTAGMILLPRKPRQWNIVHLMLQEHVGTQIHPAVSPCGNWTAEKDESNLCHCRGGKCHNGKWHSWWLCWSQQGPCSSTAQTVWLWWVIPFSRYVVRHNWQTSYGEDKILLVLLFLWAQQGRCG